MNFNHFLLFLTIAPFAVNAAVLDGSQSVLRVQLFHQGDTVLNNYVTNDLVWTKDRAIGNSQSSVNVNIPASTLGIYVSDTSANGASLTSASATYYEVVRFSTPVGGADLKYTLSIDGALGISGPGNSSDEAWAAARFNVYDAGLNSPFKIFSGDTFQISHPNVHCNEIILRGTLSESSQTGDECTGGGVLVEEPIGLVSVNQISQTSLHVEDQHTYVFATNIAASTKLSATGESATSDFLHTLKLGFSDYGGASVAYASGPLIFATSVPEPSFFWLMLSGLFAVSIPLIKRRRLM